MGLGREHDILPTRHSVGSARDLYYCLAEPPETKDTAVTDKTILLFASLGLVPIALSYGVAPGRSVTYLLGFPVETTNHLHVFRAIMGLYLANAAFWIAGAVLPQLRIPALWTLLVFMTGLAAGRGLSVVLDGIPGPVLVAYLAAEIVFALAALQALRRHQKSI